MEFITKPQVIISTGKIDELGKPYKGWFAGHFVDKESPLFTMDFELKWISRKAGEVKRNLTPRKKDIKTLGVLVDGVYQLDFLDLGERVVLKERGDYVLYTELLPHIGTCLTDSTLLVLRWPSMPITESLI